MSTETTHVRKPGADEPEPADVHMRRFNALLAEVQAITINRVEFSRKHKNLIPAIIDDDYKTSFIESLKILADFYREKEQAKEVLIKVLSEVLGKEINHKNWKQ